MVDDEASIRRILEPRLPMVGYTVATACDGEEALEMFASVEPDLVVLEIQHLTVAVVVVRAAICRVMPLVVGALVMTRVAVMRSMI